MEVLRQKASCVEMYKKSSGMRVDLDVEWEKECGICMENNAKVVLPDCNHVSTEKAHSRIIL